MKRKIVFILIDGVGDVALPQLFDMTPLQIAHTPIMDAIAACGVNGLMDSVEPGRACGSDTAHLSIFGYDPRETYRGRGAFESLGAGCSVDPGDIAFKSNFATLDDSTGVVTHRRVDRTFDVEGPALCKSLDGLQLPDYPNHSIQVMYATEHRCGVVIKGPGLSDAITDTDPLKDNLCLRKSTATDDTSEALFTAGLVNYVSDRMRALLADHPVNQERLSQGKRPATVVLLRGAGMRLKLPSFEERHGLRACMVSPTKILGGLGMTLGIHWLQVPGTTGSYDSAFHLKASAICAALTRTHHAPLPHDRAASPTATRRDAHASSAPVTNSSPGRKHHAESTSAEDALQSAAVRSEGGISQGRDGAAQQCAAPARSSQHAQRTQCAAAAQAELASSHGGGGAAACRSKARPCPPATTADWSEEGMCGAAEKVAVQGGGFDFGFVHVKAVDDCGHDRLWQLRVRYLEVMDGLATQIVRRLHEAEQSDPGTRYSILVTGDHSTPVMFGDHSHEPVPLAIADVADVAAALGPAVTECPLGPLHSLTQHSVVPTAELEEQARAQKARREGTLGIPEGEVGRCGGQGVWRADAGEGAKGDGVRLFDEVAAAAGSLGRFPGSELMPLILQVLQR